MPYTVLERSTMCFSSYESYELKVKLWWVWACQKKECIFYNVRFFLRNFFKIFCFILIYSVWNKISEYIYFCILKTLFYTFLLLTLKIVKSLQCILKNLFFSRATAIGCFLIFFKKCWLQSASGDLLKGYFQGNIPCSRVISMKLYRNSFWITLSCLGYPGNSSNISESFFQ